MTESKTTDQTWFSVRCVLHHRDLDAYEECITLWQATNLDQAIARAEDEARDHARELPDTEYTGLAQAYQLFDPPGDGTEIFSLIRNSSLSSDTTSRRSSTPATSANEPTRRPGGVDDTPLTPRAGGMIEFQPRS